MFRHTPKRMERPRKKYESFVTDIEDLKDVHSRLYEKRPASHLLTR